MRVRVIHISPTAFGTEGLFGGGERYPVELARALAREVDCKLITFGSRAASSHDGRLDITVLEPLVSLRRHPVHPVPRGLMSELAGGDIIHVHHPRAFPSRVAAIEAWSRGQSRVATDHGLGRGRGPQIVAHLFDHFLTVSRYSSDILRSPPGKTTVIYGGADTERFQPERSGDRSGVLFVGRLTPHKGVDRLIESLPQDTTLTIAGTPGHDPLPPARFYPALLAQLAEGRDVQFVGRVDEEELAALYRRARVFVLPSVHETCYGKRIAIPELLGLSLLEAMASGTPVIATRVGGLPEVVVDGQTGFVVEPGNVAELRSCLEQLLDDDGLAVTMGDNARQHVVENFTWEKCAQRCLAVYEDLMGAA
jgi:glycosyltransferase involved in cell wall biosynthesis